MSFTDALTSHTVEIGKYYIAFRIANGTLASDRIVTFTGVELTKELLSITSTSIGCVYAIYLIKTSDTTVTTSKSVRLLQISI